MAFERATVFGGSGFVGRQIVRRLAAEGTVVRVAVRDPENALSLKPMGAVGQIVPCFADVTDPAGVVAAVGDADVVVNAVSLYAPRGKRTYDRVHVEGARNVATAANAAGAQLLHMSGLGADAKSGNGYVRARGAGDDAVRAAMADAIILRPSVVFGTSDHFFSALGNLIRFAPLVPRFGGGRAHLQPVYVGDVADAAIACLKDTTHRGNIYELGGPRVLTYRELLQLAVDMTGYNRPIVTLPFWMGYLGAFFGRFIPNPPITSDMLYLMQHDNVVDEGQPGFGDLDIEPRTLEAIMPTFMDAFSRGGRWKGARLA
jgi:uncharacterized protein YbjT (DUF2867 family)